MILGSIQVQNWRCFIDPVTVGPLSDGLNVLYAPNATGKSTLFEALRRGLLDGHRVTGREVDSIRPWGRALAPTVIVNFSHDGLVYRVRKRFLDNPLAVLERGEDGKFVLLAEGAAADEKVRAILTRNPPARGLARRDHWGLAQILWAPQGDLSYTQLSGDLLTDIRASLGVQVSGPGAGTIEKKIQETYDQYFTPGGRLRTGKDAPQASVRKKELEKALARRSEAVSQQQAYENAVRRVEDLRARRAQARHDAEVINKTLKDARFRAETYKGWVFEKKQRVSRLKAAQAQYNELKQHIDNLKAGRDEIKDIKESMSKVEADLPLKAQELEILGKKAGDAKAALEDARKGRQAVDEAQEVAEQARRFLDHKRMLTELIDQALKIENAQAALAELRNQRIGLVAPDLKTLKAIRKAVKERDDAQVRIDAALISLEIVAEKEASLTVITGEEPGMLRLRPGVPMVTKGSPEVVAHLRGLGRLRASGPTGSVEEHRENKARAVSRLNKLTDPFATSELGELEALNECAADLEKKISGIEAQLETLLAGRRIEDIQEDRSRLELRVSKILEKQPAWDRNHLNVAALETEAQAIRRSFIEKVESAEADWDKAQSLLATAKSQCTGLSDRLDELRKQYRSVESRLSALADDGKDDKARREELKHLALTWEGTKASLEEIEDQLSSFGEDPLSEVVRLEKQLNAADKTATTALEEEKNAEGILDQISSQGTYSHLALIEEDVAALQGEIETEEIRMLGIRLIYETLSQCRTEAVAAVVGPVEKMATNTLQRITGRRLGRLEIGDAFEPANVIPGASESSVPLENVSGGEREQIYLATRLALAETIAKKERQLVVLDDVLTFTDAGRLARVMSVLEEAAQRLQVLVLTCHPERYRGLEKAYFMDLEAIVHSSLASEHDQ